MNFIDAYDLDIINPKPLSEAYINFQNNRQNSAMNILTNEPISRPKITNRIRDISSKVFAIIKI